jgi:ketosteroid isomerase-like protein
VSEEHVEIVRRLAESIDTGDVPREIVTEDFELKNATTAVTDATYHGYEGALQWRQDFFDVVDDAHYEIDEVLAARDDYVVITNHLAGRGSLSGAPVDLRWVSVFWFREGKIARCAGFNSRRAALEAVGLPG